MAKKSKRRVVVDDPENEVARPVLAREIVAISASMTKLLRSGVNRKAIVVLTAHSSKVAMRTIEDVLSAIDQLATDYTR